MTPLFSINLAGVWNQARQLKLDDEDFPEAPALWRRGDARYLLCSPSAVDADGTSLRWRDADGPYDANTCWLLDAQRAWFARPADDDEALVPLRSIWPLLDDASAQAAVTASALNAWHGEYRFCGFCGQVTVIEDGGWVRHCDGCGRQHFPRIDPAIIVALVDYADRLLLGSQSTWGKRASVFAGFVSAGESLEQAVHREVSEETGLDVSHVSYFGSQPWPFPRSLMVAFTAHADNPDALHIDHREITSANWFTRDQIRAAWASGAVELPPSVSIAHRLIMSWLDGQPS